MIVLDMGIVLGMSAAVIAAITIVAVSWMEATAGRDTARRQSNRF
ncbi:hypothetical protein [Allorhizobium sonneratiae]|nr:hypothetical protein [Allorhizobium sonneratiae]